MNTKTYAAVLVAIMALVTFIIRALPFLLFGGKRKTPPYILYLGNVLPAAIMGMLVVYCLKDTVLTAHPYGIPEMLASAGVIALHVWKRNSLLSILGGTVLYMFLVQVLF